MRASKDKDNKQVIFWYYLQKRKFIIHPECFDSNNIFSHLFIQNINHKLILVHDLSIQMKISLKKYTLKNIFNDQIHQIIRITSNNDKTEYRGRAYAKNEVVIEPGWISNDFEWREPEFYKIVTTITFGYDSQNIYTVAVGRCNELKSVDESKYEEKSQH